MENPHIFKLTSIVSNNTKERKEILIKNIDSEEEFFTGSENEYEEEKDEEKKKEEEDDEEKNISFQHLKLVASKAKLIDTTYGVYS